MFIMCTIIFVAEVRMNCHRNCLPFSALLLFLPLYCNKHSNPRMYTTLDVCLHKKCWNIKYELDIVYIISQQSCESPFCEYFILLS